MHYLRRRLLALSSTRRIFRPPSSVLLSFVTAFFMSPRVANSATLTHKTHTYRFMSQTRSLLEHINKTTWNELLQSSMTMYPNIHHTPHATKAMSFFTLASDDAKRAPVCRDNTLEKVLKITCHYFTGTFSQDHINIMDQMRESFHFYALNLSSKK